MGVKVPPPPLDAVLFDLDGTVVDTREDIASSLNHTLGRLGRPARDLAEVTRFIGDGVRQLLARALGPDGRDLVEEGVGLFRAHYLEHCAERSQLYPGVRDTLERLSAKRLALVTNKPAAHTQRLLEALNVAGFFAQTIAGDTLFARKPEPEPVLEAAKRLGVPVARSLMVGDSPMDLQAGKAAGTLTCGVTYGYRTAGELKECGPDFMVERFADLSLFLK